MRIYCRLTQQVVEITSEAEIQSGAYFQEKTQNLCVETGDVHSSMRFLSFESAVQSDVAHQTCIIWDAIFNIVEKYASLSDSEMLKLFSHFLPPEMEQNLQNNRLDDAIERAFSLGVLPQINQSPRMSMRYDVDLLPTSRVKRYANNYQAHLAAHSECWQQRTLVGIVPKKLLAKVSEDECAIYENIVYARLIDHLQRYVSGKIVRLKQIISFLGEFDEGDFRAMDHRYVNSIMSDWGRAFDESETKSEQLQKTEVLLKQFYNYLRHLSALQSRPLYRAIPTMQQVPSLDLKQTNILLHDKNYLRLASLWRAWVSGTAADRQTPVQVQEKKQQEFEAYVYYVGWVLKQSLCEGGYQYKAGRFVHSATGLTLTFTESALGTWVLSMGQSVLCRIVAVSELWLLPTTVLPEHTWLITPQLLAEQKEKYLFALSPLSIEGKAKLTGALHQRIWQMAAKHYALPLSERVPPKLLKTFFSQAERIGFLLSKEEQKTVKKQVSAIAWQEITLRSQLSAFVCHCPCCGEAVQSRDLEYNRQGFLRARCCNGDCQSFWSIDTLKTHTLKVYHVEYVPSVECGRFIFTCKI